VSGCWQAAHVSAEVVPSVNCARSNCRSSTVGASARGEARFVHVRSGFCVSSWT